jgi:hypothetical protein
MRIRERRHPHTIRRISDDLLEEIKIILPQEKSNKKELPVVPI